MNQITYCTPLTYTMLYVKYIKKKNTTKNVDNKISKFYFIYDITLPTKVHLVKAMVFPVVMYGCESWTVKKAEC